MLSRNETNSQKYLYNTDEGESSEKKTIFVPWWSFVGREWHTEIHIVKAQKRIFVADINSRSDSDPKNLLLNYLFIFFTFFFLFPPFLSPS